MLSVTVKCGRLDSPRAQPRVLLGKSIHLASCSSRCTQLWRSNQMDYKGTAVAQPKHTNYIYYARGAVGPDTQVTYTAFIVRLHFNVFDPSGFADRNETLPSNQTMTAYQRWTTHVRRAHNTTSTKLVRANFLRKQSSIESRMYNLRLCIKKQKWILSCVSAHIGWFSCACAVSEIWAQIIRLMSPSRSTLNYFIKPNVSSPKPKQCERILAKRKICFIHSIHSRLVDDRHCFDYFNKMSHG